MNIDAKTKLYAFIGDPSGHSKSPTMHNCAFNKLNINACYLAFTVNNDNLEDTIDAFKTLKVQGANVSMPNKQAIIPYLSSLSKRARLAHAVNTITLKDGQYIGDLTDGVGFKKSLEEKGWDIQNQSIVMVGAGGASTAILVQLAMDGAKDIHVYNRSMKKDFLDIVDNVAHETDCYIDFHLLEEKETLKEDMKNAYLFINTTGVGMKPLEGQSVIKDQSYFHPQLKVADIIYNPETTKLLSQAKEAGCETVNGKLMVLYQGEESFKIWTGQDMPVEEVKKAIGVE